ncbi:MAG: PKD domain-containing protein [Bacteroidota bacterium]
MYRIIFTLIWLAFATSLLPAQINVSGSVFFGTNLENPVPNWPLEVLSDQTVLATTSTDENGNFSVNLTDPVLTDSMLTVQTFDFCSGTNINASFSLVPGQTLYLVELAICQNINPPPPVDTCLASFVTATNEAAPLTVAFTNSSSSTNALDSLLWAFGDGTTSTATNPVHTYAANGFYSVALTIYADNCEASVWRAVQVFDPNLCGCPADGPPVCGLDFAGNFVIYANACVAECAGFNVAFALNCDNDCGCPLWESPICVLDTNGDTLTFTNHCFAECAGYSPSDWVDCLTDPTPSDCGCANEPNDPVCANVLGVSVTFPNLCEAVCAGIPTDQIGDCNPPDDCDCPLNFDPVCATDGNGDLQTFNNPCLAACAGFAPEDLEDCTQSLCFCPPENAPVCLLVDTTTNFTATFPNACVAECAGFSPADFTDCGEEFVCDCPPDGEVVCVLEGNLVVSFNNACEAACYGFSPERFVDCDAPTTPLNPPCGLGTCPNVFNPVCVLNLQGDTLTFDNACLAECAGYAAAQFFTCSVVDCECEAPDFPACYFNADGTFSTVSNICDAYCGGINLDSLFFCFEPEACVADFSALALDTTNLSFLFEDASTASTPLASWSWDFGDGNSSTEQNPVHTYATAGTYSVRLTIANNNCFDSFTTTVIAGTAPEITPECQAFFFFEQPDTSNFQTFQFVDMSFGNVTEWIWDFGDGTIATTANPLHTYSNPGSYQIQLTITTATGCTSSIAIVVNADENIWYGSLACRAWFLPIIIPATNEVYFINLSSFDAVSYNWSFGDGNGSNVYEPVYSYTEPGTYEVVLTITTDDGCENSSSVILDLFTSGFTSNPSFLLTTNSTSVANDAAPNLRATAFPNPSIDQTTITWTGQQQGEFTASVFNTNGQLLVTQVGQQTRGNNQYLLQLGAFPPGLYIVNLSTPDGNASLRVSRL